MCTRLELLAKMSETPSVVSVNPVVVDWENVRWVKERGGNGDLILFRSQSQDDVGRKDLLSNREIIAPVLKHLGPLARQASIMQIKSDIQL